MNILNILSAVLALLITAISGVSILGNNKERGERAKFIILVCVGFCVMICTIKSGYNQVKKDAKNEIDKGKLNNRIFNIQTTLNSKVSSDSLFDIWLKDTFGISRNNNTPIVYNKNIFYFKARSLIDSSLKTNTDSNNIIVEKIGNDSIALYPKNGFWIRPVIGFDYNINAKKDIVPNYLEDYGAAPTSFIIKGARLKFVLWNMVVSPSKENKFSFNASSFKNQLIIFGDQANSDKFYSYYNGKLRWIPQ